MADSDTVVVPKLLHQNSHNQRASIIVRGVTFPVIGHRKYCMLQKPGVVGHSLQVIEFYCRQPVQSSFGIPIRERNTWSPYPVGAGAYKGAHVRLGNLAPDHVARIKISAFAHGMAAYFMVQEFNRRFCDRIRIIERNQNPTAITQQFGRMPVGSRNDRLTGPNAYASVPDTACAS